MNFEVLFIPWSCNLCAHEFDRMSLSWDSDQPCVWLDPLPEFVNSLVACDYTDPQTGK